MVLPALLIFPFSGRNKQSELIAKPSVFWKLYHTVSFESNYYVPKYWGMRAENSCRKSSKESVNFTPPTRPACYVMICQWSILIFLSYRSAYSLPSKIYQDSVKVFNVCETLDHVQPAIRSSPIIWRDQVSECDGVDQTATRRGTPRRDRSHPFVMCVWYLVSFLS